MLVGNTSRVGPSIDALLLLDNNVHYHSLLGLASGEILAHRSEMATPRQLEVTANLRTESIYASVLVGRVRSWFHRRNPDRSFSEWLTIHPERLRALPRGVRV